MRRSTGPGRPSSRFAFERAPMSAVRGQASVVSQRRSSPHAVLRFSSMRRIVLILAASLPAAAATVRGPADVATLTAAAEAVLHARVVARESRWGAGGESSGLIFTRVTLQPIEWWKGRGKPAAVVLRVRGGALLFWATRGHSFQIDSRGTADLSDGSEFDAVRRSFATWAAVSCSNLKFDEVLPLEQGDRRVGYFPGATNRNLVLWRTQTCASAVPANDPCLTQGGCSNKYDCWEGDSSAIATTTTTAATSTADILHAH